MRISVVIPAFNEARLLGETLRALKRASVALERERWEVEVIVCDNNSTDGTAAIARAAGARVVFEPINQIARARNTGAAAATGRWLVFLDADSQPSAGLLADMVAQIRTGCCLAGGSTVRLDHNTWFSRGCVLFWNGLSRALGLLAGSFIFVEAAAFRHLGGFNQAMFVAEELDLSRRLRAHARATGRTIVILHRHPLLTSARKLRLYSPAEHTRFFLRAMFNPGSTVGSRDACHAWYDGRR